MSVATILGRFLGAAFAGYLVTSLITTFDVTGWDRLCWFFAILLGRSNQILSAIYMTGESK